MSTFVSQQGTAAFDSTATFEPGVSPSAVKLTGSAANTSDIANIEIYDGTKDLGAFDGFSSPPDQSNPTGWTATVNLSPGVHDITAVVTSLTGQTTTIAAPFELVMGINDEPYTYQRRDLNAFGGITRVTSFHANGALVSQTSIAGSGSAPVTLSISFDPTTTYEGPTAAGLTGTATPYGAATAIEIFDGPASTVIDPTTGAVLGGAKALGYANMGANGTWSFGAHASVRASTSSPRSQSG